MNILFITNCTGEKWPDKLYTRKEVKHEMCNRYNFKEIPGCNVRDNYPSERCPPFAATAEEMYRGTFSRFLKPFLTELREVGNVDLNFISAGYGFVNGGDLIYYYDCVLKGGGRDNTRTPNEIAKRIKRGFGSRISDKECDAIIIVLSSKYFETLLNRDPTFLEIIKNKCTKQLPQIFLVGKRSKLIKINKLNKNFNYNLDVTSFERRGMMPITDDQKQEILGKIREKF